MKRRANKDPVESAYQRTKRMYNERVKPNMTEDIDTNLNSVANYSLAITHELSKILTCNDCKHSIMAVFIQTSIMYECDEFETIILAGSVSHVLGLKSSELMKTGGAYHPPAVTTHQTQPIFAQDSWRERVSERMKHLTDTERSHKVNVAIIVGLLMVSFTLYLGATQLETIGNILLDTATAAQKAELDLSQAKALFSQATQTAEQVASNVANAYVGTGWMYKLNDYVIGHTANAIALSEQVAILGDNMNAISGSVSHPVVQSARILVANVPACKNLLGMWTAETSTSMRDVAATSTALASAMKGTAILSGLGIVGPLAQLTYASIRYLRTGPRTAKGEEVVTLITQRDAIKVQMIDMMIAAGFNRNEAIGAVELEMRERP